MKRLLSVLFVMSAVLGPAAAMAAAPTTIPYQGKVTDAAGTPRNGTFSVTFRIFAASTGGSALYTETINNVIVVNGLFSVEIGNVTAIPSTVFNGSKRYLEVEFAGDGAMTPRQVLSSVPYAFRSAVSAGVASARISGTASITNGTGNFVSRTVTFPAAGVAVVTGFMPYEINHANGTSDLIRVGISTASGAVQAGYDEYVFMSSNAPSMAIDGGITVKRVFNIAAAGAETYYFAYNKTGGNIFRYDTVMIIEYFPDAVGTVATEPAEIQEPRAPQTAAEREAAGQQ